MLLGFLTSESPGVVSLVDDAFGGIGNEQSAEARTLLYADTITEINKHPIIGSGLGARITTIVQAGELTTSPHNFVLELLLRVGVIGLVAFTAALWGDLGDLDSGVAMGAARRHRRHRCRRRDGVRCRLGQGDGRAGAVEVPARVVHGDGARLPRRC